MDRGTEEGSTRGTNGWACVIATFLHRHGCQHGLCRGTQLGVSSAGAAAPWCALASRQAYAVPFRLGRPAWRLQQELEMSSRHRDHAAACFGVVHVFVFQVIDGLAILLPRMLEAGTCRHREKLVAPRLGQALWG